MSGLTTLVSWECEQFLQNTRRVCYGGTAINNILPLEDQFYDKSIEYC